MTDAARFARKAETAASETERDAWLAAARAAGERDRLLAAYVHENPRPDCVPTMRFRALLAVSFDKWCSTRAEAVAAVRRAAGLDTGGGSDG